MAISDKELESLATQEGNRVEFKESLSDRDRIKRAICAFANDLADLRQPGIILVGLRGDGSCAHLSISEEMERTAAAFRSDGSLLPMPSMLVSRRTVRGCDVLAIEVEPAVAPPVRLSGVVWVRSGSINQKATREEEQRLIEKVRWHPLPFDQRPVPGATCDDLDLDLFERVYLPSAVDPDILAANERSRVQQLAALHLATLDGQPTYAGVLVVGRDVRQWVPGAYVQYVRYAGTGLADPIVTQKQIDGPLLDVMRRLDEVIELNIQTALDILGAPTERRVPDYPVEALRQLVRNAVMHRSYEGTNAPVRINWFSDRVEIQNPGGPFGQVSRANFGQPGITDYRNPQLAEAMRVLGYVQRFGAGIPIARRALDDNGNPPPEFQVEAAHVLVTVRRSR
jgi:ATP-dependent DNA helicase RecG